MGFLVAHRVRFTPTCVGTTSGRSEISLQIGRFTPTCVGTTGRSTLPASSTCGSPPRVWGQRPAGHAGAAVNRFTPTCVGTTHDGYDDWRHGQRFTPTCVGTTSESPCWRDSPSRFTPTCVGTTRPASITHAANSGSPPRVWGQRNYEFDSAVLGGSPPRVWGQRGPLRRDCFRLTVHPHVCGDNSFDPAARDVEIRFTPTCVGTTAGSWRAGYDVSGSPPRVWGQRRFRVPSGMMFPVHPHVCGDNELRSQPARG